MNIDKRNRHISIALMAGGNETLARLVRERHEEGASAEDHHDEAGSVQLTVLVTLAAVLPLLATVAYFTAQMFGSLAVA